MTDLEAGAAIRLLSVLGPSAYNIDFHLYCLIACRMAKVAMQYGISDDSPYAFSCIGIILGPAFHRYRDGYRFAKLACDLVNKYGCVASRAKVYLAMVKVAFSSEPVVTAIDLLRVTFRDAVETGDLTIACFTADTTVTGFLLRNDPLDAVWRESERSLDFVRKAQFHEVAAVIVSQQRFIATMQGRTATFSTFSDAEFDEAAFEAQLTADRTATAVCPHWILKLQARFLSGDYAEALAAADKAKALLWASFIHIQVFDYFYYAALTVAALCEKTSQDEQMAWRDLLTAHREQLREWAENCPPTFADKHALVSAEIARIERRDLDAQPLSEQPIPTAPENGFVHNDGLSHELAAQFYAARGFEKFAHLYMREARHCYLR